MQFKRRDEHLKNVSNIIDNPAITGHALVALRLFSQLDAGATFCGSRLSLMLGCVWRNSLAIVRFGGLT